MEDADFGGLRLIAAVVAVIAFNLPILLAALGLRRVTGFSGAVQEKTPAGVSTGDVSYSRVTGLIGAVVVASLFWILSNIVIATAILSPKDLTPILANVGTLFYVGAVLFLPYAFNQLKTLLQ
ncbi:MAG TPA: hypothetical protein VNW53_07515 [Phenylobacterium sp.]|jgi:hypothetical protein|uniref:hypothetical protein n=1 Tax=Phenylobacterium sp. TaxID=1871053 RepID=UPI002CE4D5EA|nr:hypothetical protein [Phenylobacterium sp.]HXA38829.1 hypothetical protein [Phenylobacterium sp.]